MKIYVQISSLYWFLSFSNYDIWNKILYLKFIITSKSQVSNLQKGRKKNYKRPDGSQKPKNIIHWCKKNHDSLFNQKIDLDYPKNETPNSEQKSQMKTIMQRKPQEKSFKRKYTIPKWGDIDIQYQKERNSEIEVKTSNLVTH